MQRRWQAAFLALGFLIGVVFHHTFFIGCRSTPAFSLARREYSGDKPQVHLTELGVSSLLKDMSCGFGNMEVPPFLLRNGEHRVVIDVGLNMGEESIAAAKSGFIVYAFEPISEFVAKVIQKLEAEGIDYHCVKLDARNGRLLKPLPEAVKGRGMVYIFQAAAGSVFSQKTIYVDGPGTSFADEGSNLGVSKEVIVVPVSDYVDEDIYYFKIDAQGWDLEVLEGAKKLLEKHIVRLISVELWPKGLISAGSSVNAITDMLIKELGYICFDSRVDSAIQPMHREQLNEFLDTVHELYESSKQERFGFFDDLTCLSASFAAYGLARL